MSIRLHRLNANFQSLINQTTCYFFARATHQSADPLIKSAASRAVGCSVGQSFDVMVWPRASCDNCCNARVVATATILGFGCSSPDKAVSSATVVSAARPHVAGIVATFKCAPPPHPPKKTLLLQLPRPCNIMAYHIVHNMVAKNSFGSANCDL